MVRINLWACKADELVYQSYELFVADIAQYPVQIDYGSISCKSERARHRDEKALSYMLNTIGYEMI